MADEMKMPAPMVRLTIDFDPATANVTVNGPMHDGILFCGMLDMARMVYYQKAMQGMSEQQSLITMPVPRMMKV